VARVSIFLITLILLAGMLGCDVNRESYTLTIASTAGGLVTTPGEGVFTYDEGTVVNLVAEADGGYYLVKWTGDLDTVDDAGAIETTITMNDDYSITANFEAVDLGTLFAGGNGTEENPYRIANWSHLNNVRDYLDDHFILMNDLRVTTAGYAKWASPTANEGKGWQPIGTHNYPFTGTFDGQEYEIRELCSNRPDEGYVGLFGYIDDWGIIGNLGVVDANEMTGPIVGSLAGFNCGTVSNCYSTGNIAGYMCVGGLVGANAGTVSNCYCRGSVTLYYTEGFVGFVGGLVGATIAFAYESEQSIVSNSYYSYDEVLINGENIITIGALFDEDFDEWLANDKFLDVTARLSQEDGYYLISDVDDLKQLLAVGQNASLKFGVTNDLNLATEPNFYIPYLAGEFDGNGHKISNLSFDFSFVSQVGLFGYLASDASVHDVAAESVDIIAGSGVGGLVGASWNSSTVNNCYSTGSVTGNSNVGGLVGANGGTLSNCHSMGSVTGYDYVGGLLGANGGTLSNSYATGSVAGDKHVGGLIGQSTGPVSNSYSTGDVTGANYVGGLLGLNKNHATVSNSYSTGDVTGQVDVGGLVGCNYEGDVSNSYATGSVTGSMRVGGLVGRNDLSTVSNCFWDIQTSGQSTSDGGTGKTTAEMQDISTFSGATWNITAVTGTSERNPAYIWNIVDSTTYPFLSWQS
jgi:hypothetical protein